MTSEAALIGIERNGLRWQRQLKIKSLIPVVPDLEETEIPKVAAKINAQLEVCVKRWRGCDPDTVEQLLDINWICETHADLIDALNELYDWADYYRVLIC